MVESKKMKLSFTNLDRIYVVFILFCYNKNNNNNNSNNNNNKNKNKFRETILRTYFLYNTFKTIFLSLESFTENI